MNKVEKYDLLIHDSVKELTEDISSKILKSWQPFGNFIPYTQYRGVQNTLFKNAAFIQPIVKYNKEFSSVKIKGYFIIESISDDDSVKMINNFVQEVNYFISVGYQPYDSLVYTEERIEQTGRVVVIPHFYQTMIKN